MIVIKLNEESKKEEDDDDEDIKQEIKEKDIMIEHRMRYKYEFEYEFDVCNVKESVLSIEELMEYYTIKKEWTEDHHKLITFLHENMIFNQFDLCDTQNMNQIKKKLSKQGLNGNVSAQRLNNKLDDFMITISPLIYMNKNMVDTNKNVSPNTESSRYEILQKHLNKIFNKW